MFLHSHRDIPLAQHGNPRDEQPQQVHDMLPLHGSLVAQVGLQFLKLAHHIAVVGLIDHGRKERLPHGKQPLGQRRGIFNQRRIETFKDVRVGFQRQCDELLDLPIHLFGLRVLQLLRHAIERPMQFRRRQIDAPTIGIAFVVIQSIRARSDDAAVNDAMEQVIFRQHAAIADGALLELREDRQLLPLERSFKTIGEPDAITMPIVSRRPDDHAHCTTRMGRFAIRPARFHQRHNPRADGEDQMRFR